MGLVSGLQLSPTRIARGVVRDQNTVQLISNEPDQDVIPLLRTLHYGVPLEIKPMFRASCMAFSRIIPSHSRSVGAVLSPYRKHCLELSPVLTEQILEGCDSVEFVLVRTLRTSLHRYKRFNTCRFENYRSSGHHVFLMNIPICLVGGHLRGRANENMT